MDAIINRFQLGSFINHIFRCGDLAAVMQPASDTQLLPLLFIQLKVFVFAITTFAGSFRQHQRNLRHTHAVATGVRRLSINRAGNKFDERIQQFFLHLQRLPAFQRDRSETGERFYKFNIAQQLHVFTLTIEQTQHADGFVIAVLQWQHDARQAFFI